MEKEGSTLYLCPGCGAFVSESASKCPNCGETLDSGPAEAPEPNDEFMAGVAETDVGEELALLDEDIAAEDDSPPVTLYLCTECGAFTGGSALVCPNCGASMVEEEETAPQIAPEEPEAKIFDMLVQAEEPPPADENLIEDLKKLESADDVESFLDAINDDGEIGIDLEPPAELMPERSGESDDILSRLVYEKADENLDKAEERSEAIQSVESILVGESARSVVAGDNDTIALCKNCGAFVSESATVCNVCGNSLGDDERIIAQIEQPAPNMESEETADSVIRKMLGVDESAELDQDAGKRFQSDGSLGLCTICGAFISSDAPSCPVCGTHMEDMPEFVPSMDIVEPEQENHGLAICPHCGVFVPEGAKECMSCIKPIPEGATVPITREVEHPEDAERATNLLKTFLGVERTLNAEPIREKTFTGLDLCPDCGAFVSMNAVVCSVCGNSLFESAEELLDIDRKLGELDVVKCPNCGSSMDAISEECTSCGMSFATKLAEPEPEGPGKDISSLLEKELELGIDGEETAIDELAPQPEEATPSDEELLDMLVSAEEYEQEAPAMQDAESPSPEPHEDELFLEIPEAIPPQEPDTELPESETQLEDMLVEILEPAQPTEPETLEFIESRETEPEPAMEPEGEAYLEQPIASQTQPAAVLPDAGPGTKSSMKGANWTTSVYVSVAAICFFLFFYMIAPGDYAPGLAVIFGTLLLIGTYLAITDKGIFFRGDLKHGGVFITGFLLAATVLLHWPLGMLVSDAGFAGQPVLDRILLSLSILLTSIGLLWIRARVRFVFTWFFGNLLLFMCTVVSFTHSNFGTSLESPVLIVAGLGSSLIFLSLIFLQYERAINSSIETDIVRGDAHYLKRDYTGALASYDDALAKAQMKKVEALGSPIVQYDVPWYSKGSALILMGDFEEGIKCLDMALAINPNNEVTWVNKGNAHSKLGQHDLAMECYRKAIECNTFYEIAWNNLGNVHARKKDYLTALKHYNRAIKINSRYDDAWINKGYVLAKMGKREQALSCFNHVNSSIVNELSSVEGDAQVL
ncbi:MAG: tetratricopeptide repeat protein [Thermoplasmata archaeon]